jgi:hypothetical protein
MTKYDYEMIQYLGLCLFIAAALDTQHRIIEVMKLDSVLVGVLEEIGREIDSLKR